MLNLTRILLALVIAVQPALISSAAGSEMAEAETVADCAQCEGHCPDCEDQTPCSDGAECPVMACTATPAFLMTDPYVVTSAAEALQTHEPLACHGSGIPRLLLRPPIYA